MNNMNRRMARLDREGDIMIELDRMTEAQLRDRIARILDKAMVIRGKIHELPLADIAEQLSECRGEMGLIMHECELRTLRKA